MTFKKLSAKQKQVFRWCYGDRYKAIICDGAVRSGKTVCMTASFILWAMKEFDGAVFGICGKTVRSAERNIIVPLTSIVDITAYFRVSYSRSVSLLTVEGGGHKNSFYVFGGKDESSYMLIQGITLSGVLFDEVALMPRSFVEQAITRTLSVAGAKLWFNCNPDNQFHWFYTEWIQKAEERNALRLHFLMSDNPSLTQEQLEAADKMFDGVFHDRYIKGLWVAAEGLVYPMFDRKKHVFPGEFTRGGTWYISVDYGTLNPCSMGLWCVSGGIAYRVSEYYHSGRESRLLLTDEDYCDALEALAGKRRIEKVIIDPSAASLKVALRRRGKFRTCDAQNDVLNGIRVTSALLKSGRILFSEKCSDSIREFSAYCWDMDSPDDKPIKEHDHAMDDIRYFCSTVLCRELRWTDWREIK